MSLVTFPFRVKPELKQAICDRALVENRTQTDLIRRAVKEYLLKPHQLRRAEARQAGLEARNLDAAENKNISTINTAKKFA